MFSKVISNDEIFAEALSMILENQRKLMMHFGVISRNDGNDYWIDRMKKDLEDIE